MTTSVDSGSSEVGLPLHLPYRGNIHHGEALVPTTTVNWGRQRRVAPWV